MVTTLPDRSKFLELCLLLVLLPCGQAAAAGPGGDLSPAAGGMPYGPGSSWVVGHQLLEAGEVDEALPFLHLAYRSDPDVPLVALEFERALQARGYLQDAHDVMDGLVKTFPDSLSFRFRRARLDLRLGRKKEALADLALLREKQGVTEEMVSLEASLRSSMGDAEGALKVLRQGLELFPGRGPDIYQGMAMVLQQDGRARDALATLRKALDVYPRDPGLHLDLVRTLADAGDKPQALAAATAADSLFQLPAFRYARRPQGQDEVQVEASAAGPLPGSFRVELADHYAQNGDNESAMGILAEMKARGELDLGPSLWLARMYLGTGRFSAGSELVESILARWPEAARAWFLKGRILEQSEDMPGAVGAYHRAADLGPRDAEIRLALVRAMMLAEEAELTADDPDSTALAVKSDFVQQVRAAVSLVPSEDYNGQLVLGYALRLSGDLEQAARHFQLAGDDPDLRLNALVQASLCLDQAHKVSRARDLLETLRKENPDNPEIANSLGYFLAEKNLELTQAEKLVQQALDADPSNGAYLDSMGWVSYRKGDLDRALDFLIRAVNVLPDDPVILEHLGMVLRDQGQIAEAREMFQRAMALGGDAGRLQGLLDGLEKKHGH